MAAKKKKATLLDAVEANPCAETLAVYSDSLQEKEDPFGEIIAGALNGEFDEDAANEYIAAQFEEREVELETEYEWDPKTGFLRALNECSTDQGEEFITALAKIPATRLLHQLELMVWDYDSEVATDPLLALKKSPLPRSLRVLQLHRLICLSEDPGDYSGLWEHVPMIEELDIRDPDPLGAMNLPKLKTLTFSGWSKENFAELAKSDVPSFEHLWLHDTYLFYLDALDFPVPTLQKLTLSTDGTTPGDTTWSALAKSPGVGRVRTIDARRAISHRNADLVAAVAKSFTQCEEILVAGTTPALDKAFGNRVKVMKPD